MALYSLVLWQTLLKKGVLMEKVHAFVRVLLLAALVGIPTCIGNSYIQSYVRPVASNGELRKLLKLAAAAPKEKFIRNEDVRGIRQIEYGCVGADQKKITYYLNFGPGISGLWIHYRELSPKVYPAHFIDKQMRGVLDGTRDETPFMLGNQSFIFTEGTFGAEQTFWKLEHRRYWQKIYAEALRCLRENIEKP